MAPKNTDAQAAVKIPAGIDMPAEDVLDHYIRDLQQSPVLSGEEQLALARRMRRGDQDARAELIRGNLRFAFAVAKKYQHRGLPLADLVSEANVGLCHAADKYNPEMGVKFISYAVWWIKQAIFAALAKTGRSVRLPLNRTVDLSRVMKATEILRQTLNREPSVDEIAHTCGLSSDIVAGLLVLQQPIRSLDEPISHQGKEMPLANFVSAGAPDDVSGEFDAELERRLRLEDVEAAIASLPPREALILRLYFGIPSGQSETLEQIGQRLGVTRERVRQLRDRAIERLRSGDMKDRLSVYAA
jgi:RNA polymerase primary sigma factor